MYRQDILGQAISFEIATQTGEWNSYFEKSSEPDYDFSSISAKVKSINNGNFYIKAYIEKNKLDCVEIIYEDLLCDTKNVVSNIFPDIQSFNIESGIKKQANEVNQEWRIRYQADLFQVNNKRLYEKNHEVI